MVIVSRKVSLRTRYAQVVNVPASGAQVWGSNFGSVKADAALLTAHHRWVIYSKEVVLHGRADGPR